MRSSCRFSSERSLEVVALFQDPLVALAQEPAGVVGQRLLEAAVAVAVVPAAAPRSSARDPGRGRCSVPSAAPRGRARSPALRASSAAAARAARSPLSGRAVCSGGISSVRKTSQSRAGPRLWISQRASRLIQAASSGRQDGLEDRERGPQAPEGDSQLMDAFRVVVFQHRRMVGQPMADAAAEDAVQGAVQGDVAREIRIRRLHPVRTLAAGQGVTPVRLADGLQGQRGLPDQLAGQVVEHVGRALEKLELQFDETAPAGVGDNLAVVQGDLDHGLGLVASAASQLPGPALDPGGEDRLQLGRQDQAHVALQLRVLDPLQVRLGRGHGAGELAAGQQCAGTVGLGLDGLGEAGAVLADPKRQASAAQALVGGIVVDRFQLLDRLVPGPGREKAACPGLVQGFPLGRQLQLDFLVRLLVAGAGRLGLSSALRRLELC